MIRATCTDGDDMTTRLTWGLLIATKDRIGPLEQCVSLAMAQSRPPTEIVIADSSDDWQAHRVRIAALVADHRGIRFVYLQGAAPSLTIQRNQTLAEARADIAFMIDDDSFMHPTCAERIMQIYEADTQGLLAGVQANESRENPAAGPVGARKTGDADLSRIGGRSRFMRWLMARVLMRSKVDVFVPYDKVFRAGPLPEPLSSLPISPVEMFGGFRMTFRRSVIAREGFDPCLRFYCPGEDLDASYRASRHGALVSARDAMLYHHTSATNRLKRQQVAHLWSFNQAVLLRRHAADQDWARRAWRRKMGHRIATDLLKDSLMRRFDFPQTRGSLRAWREGRAVFDLPPQDLEAWYRPVQDRIVKG